MDQRPFSVGPYSLTAKEMIAGIWVVSFLLSRGATRIVSYAWLVLLTGGALYFFFEGDWLLAAWLLFALLVMFVLAPALRARGANARNIVVSIENDGLVTDIITAKSIYRWGAICASRRALGLLIVMVNPRCGVVIPTRAMSPGQEAHFCNEIDRRRTVAAAHTAA